VCHILGFKYQFYKVRNINLKYEPWGISMFPARKMERTFIIQRTGKTVSHHITWSVFHGLHSSCDM
jgi:hypothetical protein